MRQVQSHVDDSARLTPDGREVGRPRRVLHDDQLEDGERQERGDAQRHLLAAVGWQPELRQRDADDEQSRRHDVDDVVAELAREEDGEESAWEGLARVRVFVEVLQLRFRVIQLPFSILREFLKQLLQEQ